MFLKTVLWANRHRQDTETTASEFKCILFQVKTFETGLEAIRPQHWDLKIICGYRNFLLYDVYNMTMFVYFTTLCTSPKSIFGQIFHNCFLESDEGQRTLLTLLTPGSSVSLDPCCGSDPASLTEICPVMLPKWDQVVQNFTSGLNGIPFGTRCTRNTCGSGKSSRLCHSTTTLTFSEQHEGPRGSQAS